MEYYKADPKDIYNRVKKGDVVSSVIDSSQLPSKISKESSIKNPIYIKAGILKNSNAYSPEGRYITVSINKSAVEALGPKGMENLPYMSQMYPQIPKEFSKESICGSIAHELSHWLNETNHNATVSHGLDRMGVAPKSNSNNIYFSYAKHQEIDANIHALHNMKTQIGQEEWDKLTFDQMADLKPSIKSMFSNVKDMNPDMYKIWKKRFFKRMSIEGLIGKNMR